jgi:hypothetical protein
MERTDILNNLISFSQPAKDLANQLAHLNWDYDGEPVVLRGAQIENVLLRFLAGGLNSAELEDWANLIEGREDIIFEAEWEDTIEDVIYCLANPILQGEITNSLCEKLLKYFQ